MVASIFTTEPALFEAWSNVWRLADGSRHVGPPWESRGEAKAATSILAAGKRNGDRILYRIHVIPKVRA